MPPAKQNAGVILRRHESKIRKLYATQSIESVKRIMEKEPGFPELAISTWIEKFGDLSIRKNVSADEWRMIYLHCLRWLEDPTRKKGDLKLKRTKQDIEIVARGRIYSWDQAWKNMKSAGATGQLLQPGESLDPLPPEIEIHTLPPEQLPVLSTAVECNNQPIAEATDSPPLGSLSHTSQQTSSCSSDESRSLIPVPSNDHMNRLNDWTREYAETIGISWAGLLSICTLVTWTIRTQILIPPSGGGVVQRYRQRPMTVVAIDSVLETRGDAEYDFLSECQYKLRDNFLSALLWPSTTDLATSTSHKNYAKFFTVIYLLSNKFVQLRRRSMSDTGSHSDLFRELDLVFAAVPVEYLENLIRGRLVSIRAAYETLLLLTGYFNQQSAFQLLLKIGFVYDWIAVPTWSNQILYFAVSMGLNHTLRLLLDKGCRPDLGEIDYLPSEKRFRNAISEALRREDFECMHLLLECCDVNAPIKLTSSREERLSNFNIFLVEFHHDEANLENGLSRFIQAGADVNKPVVSPWNLPTWSLDWWYSEPRRDVPICEEDMCLSVLDYMFYFHRQIFHRQIFHAMSFKLNRTQPGLLSRACILLSVEGGVHILQQYLESLAQRIGQQRLYEFLEDLIAEQFLGCDLAGRKKATDLKMVCALVSCGVSIAEFLHRSPDILDRFVDLIEEHHDEYDMAAIQYLLEHGARLGGSALSWLARNPETRCLDAALNQVCISRDWHIGLADVASRNDFQAVERLLHAGIDLNVDTIERLDLGRDSIRPVGFHRISISLIARFIHMCAHEGVERPEMFDFIVKKGATLRLSRRRPQLHHLLHFVLVHLPGGSAQISPVLQYITRAGHKDDSLLPSSLLRASQGANFEHLFRYGAQLQPGSPVAHWIEMGGGIGLVREMLAAGADPNAYSRYYDATRTPLQAAAGMLRADMIELLLEEGADVNAAAEGHGGATALQVVCQRSLELTEVDEEKLKIIRRLLSRGANVNAAPARRNGYTALQATAATGDLAAAMLLLQHNPMADVNAPPCQGTKNGNNYVTLETGTALDIAAEHGRLDMVKLLLDYNAVSHRRGENGYDGAVSIAEEEGHLAVADLIREHATRNQRLPIHLRNPYLSEPPKHWSQYGYKLDLDEADSAEYDPYAYESDSSSETGSGMLYDAEVRQPSGDVQETHSIVFPVADQASVAVHNDGVQIPTQPLTTDGLLTAPTNYNNSWAHRGALAFGYGGNEIATLHPIHANQQLDFANSMELDMSLHSGTGQDLGVEYTDRLDYELEAAERLIYEINGDCE